MRARLDRVRWQLINATLTKLRAAPVRTRGGRSAGTYPYWLITYARAHRQLSATNCRPCQRTRPATSAEGLGARTEEAAPNKRIALSPDILNSIGGVMIVSADQNIRFDNTFEGRMERLADSLQALHRRTAVRHNAGEVANG